MTQLQQKVTVPDAVMEKIDAVRGRTLWVRIATAMVATVAVLLAAMALAMLIDWLAVLYDSRWRLVLTYSSLGAALLTFGVWALTAWRHSRQINRAASDVDQEMPQLEERWTTIAQLSSSPHANQVHPAMYRKVAEEANRWSPQVEPGQVVSLERLIRSLWCLMAITVVLGLAVFFDSYQTSVLLRRFWFPNSSISATQLALSNEQAVVARGEPYEITAELQGTPVSKATLLLEPTEGDAQTVTLLPKGDEDKRFLHRVRSVDSPLRYRLQAGDGRTPWAEVKVADRPKIGEVQFKVIPPRYTGHEPKQFAKFPREISTLKGSLFQLAIRPKSKVKSVELRFSGDRTAALNVDSEGWYRWETTLEESFSLTPILTEEHGLENLRAPTCEIKCREDAPPVVKILKPDDRIAVLPNDTIPIEFSAKDDVGIGSAELQVFDDSLAVDGEPLPLATIPIPLGEQAGATEIEGSVDLDLSQFELTDGSKLSFAVRVSEDRSKVAEAEGSRAASQTSELGAESNDLQARSGESTEGLPSDASAGESRSTLQEFLNAKNSQNEVPQGEDPAKATSGEDKQSALVERNEGQPAPISRGEGNLDDVLASNNETESTDNSPESPEKLAAQASGSTLGDTAPAGDPSEISSRVATSQASGTDSDSNNQGANNGGAASQSSQNNTVAETDPQESNDQPAGANSNAMASKQEEEPSQPSAANSTPLQSGYLSVPQAQSASSNRMQLLVDKTVGSFDVQQRLELEMAIAPFLEDIDVALAKAQQLSRITLDALEGDSKWQAKHTRDVGNAEEYVAAALNSVDQLQNRTRGTLYSFIGLQLVDISQAHVYPARQDFWRALQSTDESRVKSVREGWQHTSRARELLERLIGQFESARRDYALADTVDKIKKLYQVYVENSMALMREIGNMSPYSRKRVEFDLDDEYLARLQEVLEMRNEMRAELARLLADDPRLLRRFLDAQRNQTRVLRNELADLVDQQAALNRKTKAWKVVEEDNRDDLAGILLQRHVRGIEEISLEAADLFDRFETWLPLERETEDADLQATGAMLQQIAVATREVSAQAGSYAGSKTGVSPNPQEETEAEATAGEDEEASATEEPDQIDSIVAEAEKLYEQFNQLEVLLSQIGMREGQAEIAGFAATRLVETRRLIEKTSAWIRQLQYHQTNEYHRAAEIEQYQLAMATDKLAGKFANLEQQLSGTLQIEDGTLPEPIADRARALLAALDEQVAPNQLAAVYGLRRNQMPRAVTRQEAALKGLKQAEKEYDEMIRLVIEELDKFPVQDPIADLLDDPTLDDLLRQLEQEPGIRDLLGIPSRPNNLTIVDDWMISGMGNGVLGFNPNRVLMNKLREQQLKRQRAIEQAYRKALERAMKESQAEGVVVEPAAPARATVDWNQLASRLGDDLQQGRNSAPPERYRRAIEQYFRNISEASDE